MIYFLAIIFIVSSCIVIIHYNTINSATYGSKVVLSGQIWFVNGVGECKVIETYLNNIYQSSKFEDNEPIVMYATISKPAEFHRVELKKFIKSAELVPDNSYKEFVQYKNKLLDK